MAGERLLAGIEAGGTKFVLAVGTSPTRIVARHTIPTRSPEFTLAEAAEWFEAHGRIDALGIGSFGPLELDSSSSGWGKIATTPKPGWSNCDIAGYFGARLGVPVGFDTDVNAAALAEYTFGSGAAASSLAYITVGTGIGGGLVIDGKAVHGAAHPEMGHIFPRRRALNTDFGGICPVHGDCLEGLACGPAIKARWGASLSELPEDHEAHGVIADYLAQLCHTLFAVSAIELIAMGGGVLKAPGLLDRVRQAAAQLDGGYLPGGSRHRITAPGLGDDAGVIGALLLADCA
ncbi:ROK family protein [Croceicoccus sp. YJ47]|uniref:ROK family protein n=1 Tax=Croceicoccus sp. YJ47 TaxID=2798724 RepID=UPI001921C5BA|nr:ROK family protein [Croceicoccus sp. YJ47]QQN74385.1 ROK family protein [Croceicoccus sp. YJ47]